MKAGLCALSPKGNITAPTTYKIGQEYSLCVEPDDVDYYVSGCVNVTCSTPYYSRELYVNRAPTPLTTNLQPGNYYDTTGKLVATNKGGFSSPVFSGYFTNNAKNFSCSGVVDLKPLLKSDRTRRLELQQRFEFGSNDLNRLLQEEDGKGSFDTEIQLDDQNIDLLTAGTSMVSIVGTAGLVGLSTLMVSMM